MDDDVRYFRNAVSLGVKMSEDRIFVGWPGGFFVTTLDHDFRKAFQDMVAELGPPSVVEFRAAGEGWFEGSDDDLEVDDATEIAE